MISVSQIDALPVIPHIAHEILSLRLNTDEGERDLLKLIEKDPAILAKIIGLSNSPLFGTSRKILTLHDAAALLGSRRVKMVALSFAMMSSLARNPAGLFSIRDLWEHSLATVMTMDTLANFMPKEFRPSVEEIYLVGLLHDIGFLVLDYIDPRLSDEFHARMVVDADYPKEEIEAELLGMSHGELGALLLQHWNVPEPIVTALFYHHDRCNIRATSILPLVSMLNMSEKILPIFGVRDQTLMNISAEDWQCLRINPLNADEIKAKVLDHLREVTTM